MRKLTFCAAFLFLLSVAAPTFGQFVVTESGPIASAGAIGDGDNGTFSATYTDASTVFTSLDFAGELTEVLDATFASEADFNLTNSVFDINVNPSSTTGFTGTESVARTFGALFWINSSDQVNFEAFESFDDGAGADSTWSDVTFTLSGSSFTDLGTFFEGSFTFDTLGSGFDTEIAMFTSDGTLVDTNDDEPGGTLQSSITQTLTAGDYIVAVGGFNSFFSNGAGIGGASAGDFLLNLEGNQVDSGTLAEYGLSSYTLAVVVVPEPGSLSVLALFGLVPVMRRRKR